VKKGCCNCATQPPNDCYKCVGATKHKYVSNECEKCDKVYNVKITSPCQKCDKSRFSKVQ
jgi:hypothetical protein